MVERLLMPRAQFLFDADTGRYSLTVAPQDCGLKDGLHALKNPSRRLGLRKPDRRQQIEDLPSFDLSDRPTTNAREDVAFQIYGRFRPSATLVPIFSPWSVLPRRDVIH
jgi:hypothetical protein